MNRIAIVGDSCMGKSTLAKQLGDYLTLPVYCSDDFFFITKYTKKRPIEDVYKLARKVSLNKKWIFEGSTRRVLEQGLDKADQIIYLKSTSLFRQYTIFLRRNEQNEHTLSHMWHLFKKRFNLFNMRKKSYEDLLQPYKDKVITLTSFKEIDEWYKSLTTIKKP